MEREKSSQRLEFLDGLRGIAALGVIFFHFNGTLKDHGIFLMPSWIDFFFEWGHYGVQIFFVLSGFVIAYSLREAKMSSSFCFRFFFKRSIRLDPPYWAVITLMLMLNVMGTWLFAKKGEWLATLPQIFINVFYLPDFFQVPRILPVAWTLCIEIQFYLVFVFLLLLHHFYRPLKNFSLFAHLLFGSLFLLSLLQKSSWALLPHIPGLFIPYWYSFFIGCVMCWAMLGKMRISLLWIYFAMIGGYSFIQGSIEAFATLVIACIIYGVAVGGGMHRLLTARFFQYTGKISYSLYLIHWPIGMKWMDISLRFFGHQMHHLWAVAFLMATSLALTFLAAHFFYHGIELPSLNLSRRWKMPSLDQKDRDKRMFYEV